VAVDVKNYFELFQFITAVLVKILIFWKLIRSQIAEDLQFKNTQLQQYFF